MSSRPTRCVCNLPIEKKKKKVHILIFSYDHNRYIFGIFSTKVWMLKFCTASGFGILHMLLSMQHESIE